MTNIGRIVLARVPRNVAPKRQLSALVSAVDEFPGIPATFPQPAKSSSASVTTLPSGLTVVSETASSTTTVTLTYPKAGSSNESIDEAGAALANKCLAFKSGSGLSSALIMRNFEDDGALPFATSGRTSATVGFTSAPDMAVRLVPLLATNCAFEKWDVKDAITAAAAETADATSSSQVILTEQLFAAAYGAQSAMGRPYYSSEATSSSVQSFHEKAYGMSGAVLAATGVADHAAFCTALQERLTEASPGDDSKPAAAAYMGGESRVHSPSVAPQVALGFAAPSSSALSAVLKECLAIQGASAFGGSPSAGGLVGVYGSDVDAMSEILTTKPSADVIKRAIHAAKCTALFGLENGSQGLNAAMTAQVLETGTFDATGASYDAIGAKDVTAAYDAMLKSGVSMAAVGNLSSVPYHGTVASRFS